MVHVADVRELPRLRERRRNRPLLLPRDLSAAHSPVGQLSAAAADAEYSPQENGKPNSTECVGIQLLTGTAI